MNAHEAEELLAKQADGTYLTVVIFPQEFNSLEYVYVKKGGVWHDTRREFRGLGRAFPSREMTVFLVTRGHLSSPTWSFS